MASSAWQRGWFAQTRDLESPAGAIAGAMHFEIGESEAVGQLYGNGFAQQSPGPGFGRESRAKLRSSALSKCRGSGPGRIASPVVSTSVPASWPMRQLARACSGGPRARSAPER